MPLYKKRQVSCFFITLTKANSSKLTIRQMLNLMKTYMNRLGWGVRGFVWVLEVSENLHMHYHVAIATNRVDLKGKKLPNLLQLERVWGCRTEIDFVKKNIEGYLRKYFAKNSYVAENFRSYGISRKLL
jgi:flagellar biosynthesis protein FlhB